MKVGRQKLKFRFELWMVPGEDQTVDELISLAPSRGWTILSIDRERGRLLVGLEEGERTELS